MVRLKQLLLYACTASAAHAHAHCM